MANYHFGKFMVRYFIFIAIEAFVVISSLNANLEKIVPWLLGINFTIAIFSINFTFFGYQLSKYQAIYSEVTKRQWLNIFALLLFPFVPLVCYLINPELFGMVALWLLPILVLSAIDNAELTLKYLNPNRFIERSMSDIQISQYLQSILHEIQMEFEVHHACMKNEFQIPVHARDFEPGVLGVESNDLWDSMAVVTKLAIENNDYPVFRHSLKSILKLVAASYAFHEKLEKKGDYQIAGGLVVIARKRMKSVFNNVVDVDKGGIFLQSLSSELCGFLMRNEVLKQPCSGVTRAISSDAVWVGEKLLETKNVVEPIMILNTIHRIVELGILRIEEETKKNIRSLDEYNISVYAHDIKKLGVAALNSGDSHFAYRCMETLSYLGCNAAKLKSTHTIVAVFESIVQLGRVARHLKIGCFWARCLIPAESHAEEFMGHILTWLVRDMDSDGKFYMREYAEQAYSRLRGVKCVIRPKANYNPCFWIEELKNGDEKEIHIEYESGMWGYGGQLDYSDFSNLKEYVLHGIGSEGTAHIFHSEPIPIELEFDVNQQKT